VLGTYRQTVGSSSIPHGLLRSLLEHVSALALGVGILPFVVGLAWLLANLVRLPDDADRSAFACLGSITIAALVVEVTIYDLRFGGGYVHDRYLVYLEPIVLLGFVCALLEARRLRWSLLVSAALVAAGFAVGGPPPVALPDHLGRLNTDVPVGAIWSLLASWFGAIGAAQAALALAALAAGGLFFLAGTLLRRRLLVGLFTALLVVGIPAETGYVLAQLLDHDGWASRPLTGPPAGSLTWIDAAVGRNGSVAIVPHPLSFEYFDSQQLWRDLEFWNVSVDRDVQYGPPGVFQATGDAFPKTYPRFDPVTGRSDVSPAPYVAEAVRETRFRVSGPARTDQDDGVMLVHAGKRWRADWVTSGLYDDGWTRPGRTARIRVFAAPGQGGPRIRYLTLYVWPPDGVAQRPFELSSNVARVQATAGPTTAVRTIQLCVPAHGYAEVRLRTPDSSGIPADMANVSTLAVNRQGGVFLSQIALADEVGPPCSTRSRPARP
jgi:hypothetical protein